MAARFVKPTTTTASTSTKKMLPTLHITELEEPDSPETSQAEDPETKTPGVPRTIDIPIVLRRQMLTQTMGSSTLQRYTAPPSARSAKGGSGWEDYVLRIVTAGSLVTNGSGVCVALYSADPSVLPLSQWSSFAALFDEVKVTAFQLKITPYYGTSTPLVTSLATGSFLNSGSSPSTILNVLTAQDGTIVAPNMVRPHVCRIKVPKDLLFAPTTTPAGTTAYGCPGYIKLYGTTAVVSQNFGTYQITGHYHLRGRM